MRSNIEKAVLSCVLLRDNEFAACLVEAQTFAGGDGGYERKAKVAV